MIKHCHIYVLLLFIFWASPAFGDSTGEKTTQILKEEEIPLPPSLRLHKIEKLPREDNFMKEFMNMLLTLGAIIALLLLASWMLKRVANTRIQQMNESSLIKILERRTITAKTSVYLLDIKGKQIAIAESHAGLLLLPEVPKDPDEEIIN